MVGSHSISAVLRDSAIQVFHVHPDNIVVMKKKFEVNHWLQQTELKENPSASKRPDGVSKSEDLGANNNDVETPALSDVEVIIQRLETSHTDITANYSDWRDIGFAFADEFGEAGRDYFHRVSCYYPGYSQRDCDKQYDNCLKSSGHGVTIKSFFHLAQQAGISLVTTQPKTNSSTSPRPDGISKSPSVNFRGK